MRHSAFADPDTSNGPADVSAANAAVPAKSAGVPAVEMSVGRTCLRGTNGKNRRGVVAVLAAVLIIVMLAFVAFAVDVGYLSLVKTQLQATADASALAAAARICEDDMVSAAQDIAGRNRVAGRYAQLAAADVESGVWDSDAKTFTGSTGTINAARVTVRTGGSYGGSTALFFARALGIASADQSASAVATVNPRDIAFVVDLSASMNYDTRPSKADSTDKINFIKEVYSEFGFATYPGSSAYVGAPLGSGYFLSRSSSYSSNSKNLMSTSGPLSKSAYKSTVYYITSSDTADSRASKACRWIFDKQMIGGTALMPEAYPTPNYADSANVSYWANYFEYLGSSTKLGYTSYVEFMMYYGRDGRRDGTNYTAMSINSPYYQGHDESTDGGTFSFPTAEMPTHAARRAIIAALQVVKERNASISSPSQRDQVSIITFDKSAGCNVLLSLTDDYVAAMGTCTTLQACASGSNCTDTEGGMIYAYNHIKPVSEGGSGREHVNKIVVLLTDGAANLYDSSTSTINAYKSANPSSYWSNNYPDNGALMQASIMQGERWFVYPVSLGDEADTTFMNKMTLMSQTGTASFSSGTTITAYETTLKNIFTQIITRPKLRLVK